MSSPATHATILVVDDEASNRRLVSAQLAGLNYTILEAADGHAAIAAVHAGGIDAIVLDVMMPGLDGLEVTRYLKAKPETANIPILALTSLTDDSTRDNLLAAGAEDFLTKPPRRVELCARLRNLVRLKKSLDAVAESNLQLAGIVERQTTQLRRSEQLLRQTLDALPESIAIVRDDGIVVEASKRWKELRRDTGDDSEAGCVGERFRVPNLEPGHDACRAILRAQREILEAGKGRFLMEFSAQTSAGPELSRVTMTGFQNRGLNHVVVAHEDISGEREAELQLQASREQLLRSQKMEAIGKLAGGVAHDFNNLLTVIMSYAGGVQASFDVEDPRRDHLGEILSASERAAALTKQLLDFSRHEPSELSVVDLNVCIGDLQNMLERTLGAGVEFSVALSSETASVRANGGQIDQVLLNLAVNARDAMPRGGSLEIHSEVVDFDGGPETPGELSAGRHVCVSVKDTGEGIPKEIQERIFEPFFTTKERGKGTGLGLATCYGIVRASQGNIMIDSIVGEGTTFKLYWPYVEASPTARAWPESARVTVVGNEAILLVEDQRALRKAMAMALEEAGYDVSVARSGPEALDTFENDPQKFDLLLSDVLLPKLSGYEVAALVLDQRPDLPVLFVTGFVGELGDLRNALPSDIKTLRKPFVMTTLLRSVQEALSSPRRSNLATDRASDSPPAEDRRSARILLIDDDAGILRALTRGLSAAHQVVQATTLEEAHAILNNGSRVDVILCDLQLRGESGRELHESLRAAASPMVERLLFLTGGASSAEDRSFLAEHAEIVLRKPISPPSILERIEALLEGLETRTEAQ